MVLNELSALMVVWVIDHGVDGNTMPFHADDAFSTDDALGQAARGLRLAVREFNIGCRRVGSHVSNGRAHGYHLIPNGRPSLRCKFVYDDLHCYRGLYCK